MTYPLGIMVEDGLGGFGRLRQEDDTLILAGTQTGQEDFDGSLGTMTTSNTRWNLLNSAGTSTIEGLSTVTDRMPFVGDHWGRYLGDTRVTKDTDTLTVGGENGLHCSFACRLVAGGPVNATRLVVFESSVANGGVDIAGVAYDQTTGRVNLQDNGVNDTTHTVRALDEVTWTRFEWRMDAVNDTQQLRVFYGDKLLAPWWDPVETIDFTMSGSALPIEVYGIGQFFGGSNPARGIEWGYIRVGYGIWQGPADGARPQRSRMAATRLEVPSVGAA